MIQTIITIAILLVVVVLVVRYLWKRFNPPKDAPPACAGCALYDACNKSEKVKK